jgi:hypothetical protein
MRELVAKIAPSGCLEFPPVLPRLVLAATFAAALVATPAGASTIVHDSVGDFAQLSFSGGGPVSADRRVVDNMFDSDHNTMRSLGIGGTFVAGIATDRSITSITLSELTFGVWTNHREQLTLSLALDANGDGLADGAWVDIGVLRNDEWRASAAAVPLPAVTPNLAQSVATLSGTFAAIARTDYTVTVDPAAGQFNLIRFVDSSPFARGRDGFDIAELRVVSQALPDPVIGVPAPMSLALFGAGLLGFGITRRLTRQRG